MNEEPLGGMRYPSGYCQYCLNSTGNCTCVIDMISVAEKKLENVLSQEELFYQKVLGYVTDWRDLMIPMPWDKIIEAAEKAKKLTQ